MSDRPAEFGFQLQQVRDFLRPKAETQAIYGDALDLYNSLAACLETGKPIVKIVSPTRSLAASFKVKHETDPDLRSLYEFQAVAPIVQRLQIVQDCDLICLVYEQKQVIRPLHYQLIELANKRNLALLIIVEHSGSVDINDAEYRQWQQNLADLSDRLLPIPSYFIDLDRPAELDLYQRSLVDLASQIAKQRQVKIVNEAVRQTKGVFNRAITSHWQAIKQTNEQYGGGRRSVHLYQQQLRQNTQAYIQFRQQLIGNIKQAVHHYKTDLLNPFAIDSLIFYLQQLVNSAQVKIVKEGKNTYLYLTLTEFPAQPLLHNYVLEFCQQKIDEILAKQWLKIDSVYGAGGLTLLAERCDRELDEVKPLLDYELKPIPPVISAQPSLKIEEIIDPYCLEISSKIPFDYSLTQSSWFRLFISVLVGSAIYLSTWLFFGTGRYIGFMIIIFQLISLITGQSVKKARLKQQTKELKRITDQKYQNLVRTIVAYLSQTTIAAIDKQCQFYQQEYTQAIATAHHKLDELKQSNEEHKTAIENLKGDRDKIIALLD